MRALITGGAGFVGSHLADELLRRNDDVMIIDDLSTGSVDNIAHLKSDPRFSCVLDNVHNRSVMAELVDRADVVFHLAAAVGVRLIIERPVHTIEVNIKGTEIVLELAAKKRKKVVIASTSEVYGKSDSFPFDENGDILLGPTSKSRWGYACSKAIDEFLALAYWREKKVPVVIVRLFNTVGPRQTGHYGMVIPNFVRQALSGGPITVFGDGSQTRCFTWVGDVVAALADLAAAPPAVGHVFNVGSQEEISISALAELVKRKTDSAAEVRYVPYDEAYEEGFEDMPRRVPDLRRIQMLIGYSPSMKLEGILEEIIAYYRNLPRERW
jgi:UDP-glucose 4-epimerase